ncbi:MAG: radical SAM family heme chaperone HemW [Clostridia bacterium]|nr:radical SAM family heme chaperone HemW [Clostridia bacterium]
MAGIYVHVPFCKSKCTYCDFASYPREKDKAELYFACLYKEAKARANQYAGMNFDTVYVGGGTPSFVDEKLVTGALKQIKEKFSVSENAEITVEINPGTLTENKLSAYRAAGVNRYSLGLQSADDAMLVKLNRIHTVADYVEAAKMLEGENFNADALIGLFDQTVKDVENTLSVIIGSGASHVSVYALRPEEGTPIFSNYLNGDLPDEDAVADLYAFAAEYLEKRGFYRYEVSNFAKKGCESRHNLNYWQRGEYVGLGVAASSHVKNRRFTNTAVIDEYIKCILSGHFAEISSEEISGDEIRSEYVMLALRTAAGIDLAEFEKLFGKPFEKQFEKQLETQGRYMEFTGGRVRIKPEYLFVQNSVIINFI